MKRRHPIEQHERVTMRTRVCSSGGDSLTSSERKLSRTAALPRMLICLAAVKIRSLSAPQVGQVLASGREVGGSSQSPLCTACIRTTCYYQLPRMCVPPRLGTVVGVRLESRKIGGKTINMTTACRRGLRRSKRLQAYFFPRSIVLCLL